MKNLLLLLFLFLQIGKVSGQEDFSFVFLPDTHLRPDSLVMSKFDSVVSKINALNPDFILTGGDMIYTAKNVDNIKAKVLFDNMDLNFAKFDAPVKYTMGNHEIVGVLEESGLDPSHPLWGKNMYVQRYGETYYTFNYGNWKFFVLDGILISTEARNYFEGVDSVQLSWIRNELQQTDQNMPLCVVVHTPLIDPRSITRQEVYPVRSENARKVLAFFDDHNLKLVLQGHNHVYMKLDIGGVVYYSGGSTAKTRDVDNVNDGFALIHVLNESFDTEFYHTSKIE